MPPYLIDPVQESKEFWNLCRVWQPLHSYCRGAGMHVVPSALGRYWGAGVPVQYRLRIHRVRPCRCRHHPRPRVQVCETNGMIGAHLGHLPTGNRDQSWLLGSRLSRLLAWLGENRRNLVVRIHPWSYPVRHPSR